MNRARLLGATLLAVGFLLLVGKLAGQSGGGTKHQPQQQSTLPQGDGPVEQGVMQGMSHHGMDHHDHTGPMDAHMKWSTLREPSEGDEARAEQVVTTLQKAIEKYKDYRVALKDGFKPFLPGLKTPETHFTNYAYGFLAAFSFDPSKPTSLLYRRTDEGWELIGAMYTAPERFTEDQLQQRVPLSVAQWHQHVNICLPAKGQERTADWGKFGPAGSIASKEACDAEGGRFLPHLFGWMVHVYPYEKDPQRVWAHPMHGKME